VAVVEEDSQSRHSLVHFLSDTPGFHCSGAYGNLREAHAGILATQPSIVLTNLLLPDGCGIEFTRLLKRLFPSIAIVIVSGFDLESKMTRAFAAGASGYIVKPFHLGQLLATLKFSLEHHPASRVPTRTPTEDRGRRLSSREESLMKLLSTGLLYKEIADEMHVSEASVRKHVHGIYQKLHVGNRAEAVQMWASNRI
jgi:DNA-binding NarL/FixJ family response regulator